MKNILAAFLFLMIPAIIVSAQSFEGKVTYANSYKSKLPNMTGEQFTSMMGDKQEYFIKDGNYKSSMNGTILQWQIYRLKDNKLYTKMAVQPAIFYHEGTFSDDEVIKSEINKGVTEVLGYKCDELVLTTKKGTQRFYFNPVTKISSDFFKNHKFGNWSEVMSKINALPLKMNVETPEFSMESVATEIQPMKLDEKIFELPEGMPIQKSPF
jgi:hypothetical protein